MGSRCIADRQCRDALDSLWEVSMIFAVKHIAPWIIWFLMIGALEPHVGWMWVWLISSVVCYIPYVIMLVRWLRRLRTMGAIWGDAFL